MDEWFALSAKYYLDEKMADCNANVERMFTRLLAYCRLARTGGFVPQNAHVLVGLPTRKRDVFELSNRGVLEAQTDRSGWRFPAWDDWQEMGDALDKRRKSDRLRKRRQRQGVTGQSRDVSAKCPPLQNSTEQDIPSRGSSSSNGSNTRERENAPTGPPIRPDAWALVRDAVSSEHPQATRSALALEAGAMLVAGTPQTDVTAALELWLSKPSLGPRTLPSLVSEVIRSRDRPPIAANGNGHAVSTADLRVAQAQAFKSRPGRNPLELT